jgi:hypothetical protein
MEMSSVSDEDEWTLSASRGYGEAAARARMCVVLRRVFPNVGLARLWFGGESAGVMRSEPSE